MGKWLARASLVTALMVAMTGTAAALTGKPVLAGMPGNFAPPVVAVDSTGTAYVVWRVQTSGSGDTIGYCVIPSGATACVHAGTLQPADGAAAIDGLSVVADGGTIVVLADVFGTQGTKAADYQPLQEWQSTDGGATWGIVDGGLSVANASLSADTGPNNAVIVPGTNVLGFGWTTAGGPPTFNAFPLTQTSECSKAMCGTGFATLQPSNELQISNVAGYLANQAGATPGVLAVYDGGGSTAPYSCVGQDNIPFAYGAGNQTASNDYNLSPGQVNSAWRLALTRGICNAHRPAVAGGPSGFGVLAFNESNGDTSYWRFDQTHLAFDLPPASLYHQGELFPSLSQDAAGGVYATFLYDGSGGEPALAFSPNGGTSWLGPIKLNGDNRAGSLSSAVSGGGQGWAAWADGLTGTVYAQQFVKTDANPTPTTLVTVQTAGSKQSPSVTIGSADTGETDRATVAGQNASTAGGTVHYALFSDSKCNQKVFDGGTHGVVNGTADSSSPVTSALAPGDYFWQATYGGDGQNAASTSTCGGEKLTVSPNVSAGGSGTSTTTTITVTVTCKTLPCTITVTIAVTIGPAADAQVARVRTVTLGTARVTLRKRGAHHVVIHLTKAGKRLLKARHGRLTAKLMLSQKIRGKTIKTSRTIHVTPAKRRH